MSFKLFYKIERDENLSNSFYTFNIMFIPIADKNYTEERNKENILAYSHW